MKNLKRVLSLGLASVMLLGMMVMGASAAGKDFTDAEDIVHDEAVDVMVALKIINGKEDGSYFAPKDTVTRGEMAKMIAVAMNGGSEANTGVKSNPTFTDIGGHWAEGWIEYCADMKIINGRGDGTFAPNDNVTGVEALKMVLTAMGYDAEAYHLQGAAWASQTLERARQCNPVKLTDELDDVVMTEPATRDVAAQMIWNGLQSYVVTNSPDQNTNNGEVTWRWSEKIGTTLLKQRYDANVWTGNFDGNYNTGASALKGEIAVSGKYDVVNNGVVSSKTFDVDFPYDYPIDEIGEEVKVVWKDGTRSVTKNVLDNKDVIYGVFNTGATRVVRSQLSKIKDNKTTKAALNIDGTLYDCVKDGKKVDIIVNYNTDDPKPFSAEGGFDKDNIPAHKNDSARCEHEMVLEDNSPLTKALKYNSSSPIKAVFNDDGEICKIYVTESQLATVTGVNSTTVSINRGVGNLKIADHDIEEGLKRGDVVVVTPLYDLSYQDPDCVATVRKAEVVSGELTEYKSTVEGLCEHGFKKVTSDADESLTVGGKTYKVAYKNNGKGFLRKLGLSNNIASYSDTLLGENDIPEVDGEVIGNFYTVAGTDNDHIGEDFDLYLINGYVYAAVQTSEGANNYSVITEVREESKTTSAFSKLQLEVMGADGTREIITVSQDSRDWVKDSDPKVSCTHGSDADVEKINVDDYVVGDIITYTFDSKDEAVVNLVAKTSFDDNHETALTGKVTYSSKSKMLNDIVTTSDAVLYVQTKAADKITWSRSLIENAKWEAYSIRDLETFDERFDSVNWTVATNKDDKVVAAYVNLCDTPDGATDDTVYAIISGYNGRTKDYYIWTAQSNGEEYTLKIKADAAKDYKTGNLVAFRPTSDDTYKKTDVLKMEDGEFNAANKKEFKSVYVDEYDAKAGTLSFYTDIELKNGSYEGKGAPKAYALDKDCKIVYVNQDSNKSEAEGSISSFSTVDGTRNAAMYVTKAQDDRIGEYWVIKALFIETSNAEHVDKY